MNKPLENRKPFDYEKIEAGYYDQVYHRNRGTQSKWHHLKFAFIASRMGDYRAHLDVGCGPGTFIGTLDPKRHSIGVDIVEGQIAYAKAHYETGDHVFQMVPPNPEMPFNDDCFDVVTLVEVIEHLPVDYTRVLLGEIRRVLKPGGRVLLTTPNYMSLWPVLEFIVNRSSKVSYEDQHITHYSKRRLREQLLEAGFSIGVVRAFQFLAPFTAGICWPLADKLQKLETCSTAKLGGFLLFAEGIKR